MLFTNGNVMFLLIITNLKMISIFSFLTRKSQEILYNKACWHFILKNFVFWSRTSRLFNYFLCTIMLFASVCKTKFGVKIQTHLIWILFYRVPFELVILFECLLYINQINYKNQMTHCIWIFHTVYFILTLISVSSFSLN